MKTLIRVLFRRCGGVSLSIFCLICLATAPALADQPDCIEYQEYMRYLGPLEVMPSANLVVNIGSWAFVSDGEGNLVPLDFTDPLQPVAQTALAVGGRITDMVVGPDNHLLLTVEDVGLVIVLVGSEGTLSLEGSLGFATAATAVDVCENRAFVIIYHQLVIVDWSSPLVPIEIGQMDLPGGGSAISVLGSTVFIGGVNNEGPALWLTDVSDPGSPVLISESLVVIPSEDGISGISDILLTEDRIYLAFNSFVIDSFPGYHFRTSVISLPSDGCFDPLTARVIDVNPYGEAANLILHDNQVFVFCEGVGIVDISDPEAPFLAGYSATQPSYGYQIHVSGMVIGNHAVIVARQYGLHLVDLGNRLSPSATTIASNELPLTRLATSGNLVYGFYRWFNHPYSAGSELCIYDLTNPLAPVELGTYVDERDWPPPWGILCYRGDYLFSSSDESLDVYNISNLNAPVLEHFYNGYLFTGPYSAFSGDYLYLCLWSEEIRILDISVPSNIVTAGTMDGENVRGMVSNGEFLYLYRSGTGLEVYSLSNPTSPELLGTLSGLSHFNEMWIYQNLALVGLSGTGILILDISDPTTIEPLSMIPTAYRISDVVVEDGIAYLAGNYAGCLVVDIRDPESPISLGNIPSEGEVREVALFDNLPLFADKNNMMLAPPQCVAASNTDPELMTLPSVPLNVSAHPNPFNPSVSIKYFLPEAGFTKLKVFNLRGQLVQTLFEGQHGGGWGERHWNGLDSQGQGLPSGTYLVRLETQSGAQSKKVMLVR